MELGVGCVDLGQQRLSDLLAVLGIAMYCALATCWCQPMPMPMFRHAALCRAAQVRSTHGAHEGTWYFEVEILGLGETGAARLGWSTGRGEVQAPVGYDVWSYGYRSLEGSKVGGRVPLGGGGGFCLLPAGERAAAAAAGHAMRCFPLLPVGAEALLLAAWRLLGWVAACEAHADTCWPRPGAQRLAPGLGGRGRRGSARISGHLLPYIPQPP